MRPSPQPPRTSRPLFPLKGVTPALALSLFMTMVPMGHASAQDLPSKGSLSPAERKMTGPLVQQARAALLARGASAPVFVEVKAEVTPALLAFIEAQGGTAIRAHARFASLSAMVPPAALTAIAARAEVRSMGPKPELTTNRYLPTPQEQAARRARLAQRMQAKIGSVTWEGVSAHRANVAHAAGFKGAGIKICVMSDGIKSLQARVNVGTLPAVQVLPGQAGPSTGDEGTAMLEIVHDMAPEATLGFATAYDTQADFAQNVLDLHAAGCHVIVDDITYYAEGAFQDGPVAQAVNEVVAQGVLYFSSAANSGNLTHGRSGTYEGDFVASTAALPTVVTSYFGTLPAGITLAAQTFAGGQNHTTLTRATYYVSLQWSDPLGHSSNDYDLIVTNANGTAVLSSGGGNSQDGTQDAFEFAYRSNGQAFPIGSRVYVIKYSGEARALRLDAHRGSFNAADATAGSTYSHNAARGAMSVASVDLSLAAGAPFTGGAANPVQTYSSDGPRHMFFHPDGTAITPGNVLFGTQGGEKLAKVDMAAGDCGSTTTPNFLAFCGTSAAAPTAAALAALVKSANPSATSAQVLATLRATALDIEASGDDRDAGMGLLMLPTSMTPSLCGEALPAAAGSVQCTPVALGGNGSCTATANAGWRFKDFANACTRTSGADASTCELDTVVADATVTARFEPHVAGPTVPGTGAGGTGSAGLTGGGSSCAFDLANTGFTAAPADLPAGQTLPQGVFKFKLQGCTPGATVSLRITWPEPVGTYAKWGYASAQDLADGKRSYFEPSWQPDPLDPRTVILSVTDGGLGDDDWAANGEIVDPSGPTTPAPSVPVTPAAISVQPVPTLGDWGAGALALLAASLGVARLRRRQG